MKKTLLLLILILISSEVFALRPGIKHYPQPIKAADFTLTDSSGNIHRLNDYRGSVLIINFWATWCVPCRKEIPALKQVWSRLHKENIPLLGIATKDSKADIVHFQKENNIEFPLPMDADGKVADEWGVIAVPTAFVVNTSGDIAMRIVGGDEWNNPELLESIISLKHQSTDKLLH